MRIRITRELVKELNGARRRLSAGKVMELRDPDAADLIANGYAEPFPVPATAESVPDAESVHAEFAAIPNAVEEEAAEAEDADDDEARPRRGRRTQ